MAVIGEPTNLVPVLMHKGHMSHRIQVIEQSGHTSKPSLGVNFIDIMYQFIGDLISLKEKMAINYANYSFDTPQPTLNFGAIQGGDNAHRIYAYYQLDIHMRSLLGMNDHELVQLLSDALAPLAEKYPDRISFDEFHPSSPSFEEQSSAELATFAEKISKHKCCAENYPTEASYIQKFDCQTIVFRPRLY